jgi:hypothetical protein
MWRSWTGYGMRQTRHWSNAMDTTETGTRCKDVERASSQIRTLIGDRTDIFEILDRFWLLEDSLNRLVDVVDRERDEVSQYRTVIRTVVNTLQSPQARKRATVPGVRNACDKINGLLINLERMTQQARADRLISL